MQDPVNSGETVRPASGLGAESAHCGLATPQWSGENRRNARVFRVDATGTTLACLSTVCGSTREVSDMSIDLLRIGQLLKEEREKSALSLADISGALLVRESVVAALESGRWELLPHRVYVKGYVKQYARYLGISGDLFQEPCSSSLSPRPLVGSVK